MNLDFASLDRRKFLRGTSVALVLPWLESFAGALQGGKPRAQRKRLACVYWPAAVPLPLTKDPPVQDLASLPPVRAAVWKLPRPRVKDYRASPKAPRSDLQRAYGSLLQYYRSQSVPDRCPRVPIVESRPLQIKRSLA